MKILMVVSNLRASNGVTSFIMNYYRNLDHENIVVDFAEFWDIPNPYEDEIKKNGGKVFVLPPLKNIAAHFKKCVEIIRDGQYDVIHNNTLHIAIPILICALRYKVPVRILHSHNSKMGETPFKEVRNNILLPIIRALATDYAACSQLAGKAMFGNKNFTVISNVIDDERVKFDEGRRTELRKQLNIENKKIVLSVGRVAPQKNPFFAVDVCIKAHQMDKRIVYWWVGNGPQDEEVKEYVKQKHAGDYIKFWGSRNDVIDFYQVADCFFLPSLFEGLPLTGVEAQAMGLPMIVSDTVTDEMVYTDLVKFVSLSAKIEEWATKIAQAVDSQSLRNEYTFKLKNSIFADSNCGEYLVGFYMNSLEKKR